ncbi:MAG: hypothetical protein R2856_11670 [Caldilineaceae bacterium]
MQGAIDRLSIDTRAASQVRRLSGGNQQKVAIGRWLVVASARCSALTPPAASTFRPSARSTPCCANWRRAAAVLLYTSELAEIPLVCDRVIILYNGAIVAEQDAAGATESSLLTTAHGLEVPA